MLPANSAAVARGWLVRLAGNQRLVRWLMSLLACAPLLCDGAEPIDADRARYEALLQYQGRYEYENGGTIEIAASPKDLTLFALVGGARYRLAPTQGETFLDAARQRVVFQREDGGGRRVVGYRQPDSGDPRLYRRLPGASSYPRRMWYPRQPGQAVGYAPPVRQDDGLPVGRLEDVRLEAGRIGDMIAKLAAERYPDVHSVLVLQDGRLVLEEYFYEYDADTPHPLRSATKSIVALLAGIALDRGLLPGLDAPVLPYFKDDYPQLANADARKARITLRHLLTQTAGLDCNDWDPESVGNESRIARSDDWVRSFLDLPALHEPGTHPSYCSAGVIALGRVVEKAAGMPIERFADQALFAPLGIRRYEWRFDPDRSSAETFAQISLRPRDMAKIGLLLLHDGRWQGRQVVPAAWIREATRKHVRLGDTDYGYLWWRPYLNVPGGRHDALMATGNGGQKIMVWPELDMVTVFTGGNYNRDSPVNELLIGHILPPRSPAESAADVAAVRRPDREK